MYKFLDACYEQINKVSNHFKTNFEHHSYKAFRVLGCNYVKFSL